MTDFSDMARVIIESNRYMVLGTADEDGVPWRRHQPHLLPVTRHKILSHDRDRLKPAGHAPLIQQPLITAFLALRGAAPPS